MKSTQIKSYNDDTFRLKNNIFTQPCWNSKDHFRTLVYDICKNVFSNIETYPYVYFTNGVTEALNALIPRSTTYITRNEYRYLNVFPTVTNDESSSKIKYLSFPFSGNGKFVTIPEDKPVILDCSYLFATHMIFNNLLPSSVEYVLFGLSKSHNIADYRIGWMFTKKPIREYHILQYENNYAINNVLYDILLKVKDYELNYLYLKYKEFFSDLYIYNKLVENDTNLFGMNESNRVPWYHLV